ALAREALGLRREFFQNRFELTTDFGESFGGGGVRQEFAARTFDGRLGFEHFRGASRVRGLRLFELSRARVARLAHLHVLQDERLALRRDRRQTRAHRFGLAPHLFETLFERGYLLALIRAFALAPVESEGRLGDRGARFGQLLLALSRCGGRAASLFLAPLKFFGEALDLFVRRVELRAQFF